MLSEETKIRALSKMARASGIPQVKAIEGFSSKGVSLELATRIVGEVYSAYSVEKAKDMALGIVDQHLNSTKFPNVDAEEAAAWQVLAKLGEPCC